MKDVFQRLDSQRVQALASVALVVLTFCYVVATVFMVRASDRMAQASDATRADFAARRRPYLSFAFDDDKAVQAAGASWILPVKATDYGEFPAYHVRLWARAVVEGREIFSSREGGVEQTILPKETLRFSIPVPGRALNELSRSPNGSFLEFRAEYSGSPAAGPGYSFSERVRATLGKGLRFSELGRTAD